jgi:hypothetical protein
MHPCIAVCVHRQAGYPAKKSLYSVKGALVGTRGRDPCDAARMPSLSNDDSHAPTRRGKERPTRAAKERWRGEPAAGTTADLAVPKRPKAASKRPVPLEEGDAVITPRPLMCTENPCGCQSTTDRQWIVTAPS